MTTLTSSATLAIGDAPTTEESVTITVLPVAAPGEGRGRLIHPTLGTYDYARGPDEWQNLDGDVVIAPIWASEMTLDGAANTLWPGALRDVIVEERWIQPVAGEIELARMLMSMWTNPVDPADGAIEWWPSYATTLGYQVALLDLRVGAKEITLTPLLKQGWVRGPITLRMRILGRA